MLMYKILLSIFSFPRSFFFILKILYEHHEKCRIKSFIISAFLWVQYSFSDFVYLLFLSFTRSFMPVYIEAFGKLKKKYMKNLLQATRNNKNKLTCYFVTDKNEKKLEFRGNKNEAKTFPN